MDTYTLPNGRTIDIEGCVDAVLSYTEYPQHYLDTETGNVCVIDTSDALKKLVEEIGASRRYLEITHFDEDDYNDIMEEFLDAILRVEDPKLFATLACTFETGGWQAVIARFEKMGDEWIVGWNQWICDEAWLLAEQWVTHIPNVPVNVEFEGCEDCAVCELMRKGEDNNFRKLMHAFDIENSMQEIAGASTEPNEKRPTKKIVKVEKRSKTPPCGLCGKSKKPRFKTECCDNWVCGDENAYVLFSYSRDICSRNHRRLTLCGYHREGRHPGNWKDCKECIEGFEPEMAVWYGTNEYNFEKHPNPPAFKPTHCTNCNIAISLGEDGYTTFGGMYACEDCVDGGFTFKK
ncbi:hypothetical protein FJY93_02010 [Candidatus Kaiserbacteria bacterium]|nr:hypothetical protein [Candidatus Kaiserbacteria bacterium]